jgi:hypothetical protein
MYGQLRGTRADVAVQKKSTPIIRDKLEMEDLASRNQTSKAIVVLAFWARSQLLFPIRSPRSCIRPLIAEDQRYKHVYLRWKSSDDCAKEAHIRLRGRPPQLPQMAIRESNSERKRLSVCLTHRRLYSFHGLRASCNNRAAPDPGPRSHLSVPA